jgi:hypothetical protein
MKLERESTFINSQAAHFARALRRLLKTLLEKKQLGHSKRQSATIYSTGTIKGIRDFASTHMEI